MQHNSARTGRSGKAGIIPGFVHFHVLKTYNQISFLNVHMSGRIVFLAIGNEKEILPRPNDLIS
jgi:hypothetical protein